MPENQVDGGLLRSFTFESYDDSALVLLEVELGPVLGVDRSSGAGDSSSLEDSEAGTVDRIHMDRVVSKNDVK